GLQRLDHRCGGDDRVEVRGEVPDADVVVPAADPDPDPGQPDLLPGDRPTGLGDHRVVGQATLFDQVRTTHPVADGAAATVAGRRVGRHAARAEPGQQVTDQRDLRPPYRLGRHQDARGVPL